VNQPMPSSKRVLIVKDEPLISMLLEDMLVDLGYEVAGTACRLEDAL
jgi:CheY-like chemotaxis protein